MIKLSNFKGKSSTAGKQYEKILLQFLNENEAEDLREEIEKELEKLISISEAESSIDYIKQDLEDDLNLALKKAKKVKKEVLYTKEELTEIVQERIEEALAKQAEEYEKKLKEAEEAKAKAEAEIEKLKKRIEELETVDGGDILPPTPPTPPTPPKQKEMDLKLLNKWISQVIEIKGDWSLDFKDNPNLAYNVSGGATALLESFEELQEILEGMINKNSKVNNFYTEYTQYRKREGLDVLYNIYLDWFKNVYSYDDYKDFYNLIVEYTENPSIYNYNEETIKKIRDWGSFYKVVI